MGIQTSTLETSQCALKSRRRRLISLHGEPLCCYMCHSLITWETAELDHIFAKALGGSDEPYNRAWACIPCNRMKGDRHILEYFDHIDRIHRAMRCNGLHHLDKLPEEAV